MTPLATDRTERLLNLVICLLGTRRPIPRANLRASIPGYGDATSNDAFERMFERDKDELRQMGIPVETIVNAQGEVEGYLIDQDDYAMPDIALDAAEFGVLGLAARAWSEAALAAEAGAALRKIEAAVGERSPALPLVAGRPGAGEEHLPTLWEAIRTRCVVAFEYLPRGRDAADERIVEPWATVYREGAWYLVGLSRERDKPRAFRLSRILGRVRAGGESFDPAPHEDIDEVVASLQDPATAATARVRLPSAGAARLGERARPVADGSFDVDYADEDLLIAQVLESGGTILEPAELAVRLRERLRLVVLAHGGDDA